MRGRGRAAPSQWLCIIASALTELERRHLSCLSVGTSLSGDRASNLSPTSGIRIILWRD